MTILPGLKLPTRQNSVARLDGRDEIAKIVVLETWQPPNWLNEPGDDPARAVVMAAFRELADSGMALWSVLESGDVHLSCETGEVFHLTEYGVRRIR
jgi:hypothetical protein